MKNNIDILNEGQMLLNADSYNNYVLNKNSNSVYRFYYAARRKYILFNRLSHSESIDTLSEGFYIEKTFDEFFNSLVIDKSLVDIYHYSDVVKNIFSTFFHTFKTPTDSEDILPFTKAIEYVINNNRIATFANDKYFRFFIFHKDEQKVYYVSYSNIAEALLLTPIELNNSIQFSSEFIENVKNIPMKIYNSFEEYFFNGIFEDLPSDKDKEELIENNNQGKWKDFRESGLLWFINSILHVFGWAIKYEIDSDTKEILSVYPDRVKFRGFSEELNTKGYINLSKYMKENAEQLLKEAKDE